MKSFATERQTDEMAGRLFRPPTDRPEIAVGADCSRLKWLHWPAEPTLKDDCSAMKLKGIPRQSADPRLATIVCAGMGAVGGPAVKGFSRLGVGHIIGVDPDSYESDSWLTQPIRRYLDTGKEKAALQGKMAHEINPGISISTACGQVQDLPYWIFRTADILVSAGDNLEMLVALGVMATAFGKPLIQGAVYGESWLALTRHYELRDPENACPGCALSRAEWASLSSRAGCDPATVRAVGGESTRTLPMICNLSAALLASKVAKLLFGVGDGQRVGSEELVYSAIPETTWRTKLERNPACRCPHKRWGLVDISASPSEVTLSQLSAQFGHRLDVGHGAGKDRRILQVKGEIPWVSYTFCTGCQRELAVYRFAHPGTTVGRCRCGETLLATPLGVRSTIPPDDIRQCAEMPLSELGVLPGEAVGFSVAEDWTYFFVGKPDRLLVPALDQGSGRKDVVLHK